MDWDTASFLIGLGAGGVVATLVTRALIARSLALALIRGLTHGKGD